MSLRSSSREGRRGRLRAAESVAGWVFADMLLVLFIVGLGTAIPLAPSEPPRAEPKPRPEPKPEPKPEIVGMETIPVKKEIGVDPAALTSGDSSGEDATCAALKKAFRDEAARASKAAFVMVFGGGSDPGPAIVVANEVFDQLPCAAPQVFPNDAVGRAYWDGGLAYDRARVEVFLFTTKNGPVES